MKYDDASWHAEGDFPENSPEEFAGTHIALFMKWCFVRGWAGELHLAEWPEDVSRVVAGQMSATEFLFKNCDGKLTDEDLNEEGNRFAAAYYGEDGQYTTDYSENFSELVYVRPEADHDFAKFSAMIDRRFKREGPEQNQRAKSWWKFW